MCENVWEGEVLSEVEDDYGGNGWPSASLFLNEVEPTVYYGSSVGKVDVWVRGGQVSAAG